MSNSAVVIHHSNHTPGHPPAPADVIVDALPYYDSGYDEPGAREAVNMSGCLFVWQYSFGCISRLWV